MSNVWKRIGLILMILLIAASSAYLLDRAAYQHFGTYFSNLTDVYPVFTDGSEAFGLYHCSVSVSDGSVTVLGEYPQFYLFTNGQEFSATHVSFREPVKQEVRLQVFYAPDGQTTQENSVWVTIQPGTTDEIIPIPKGIYTIIRFDFHQDVMIRRIEIGNAERIVLENKLNPIRAGVIFSVIFFPLLILILMKTRREEKETKQNV